MTLTIGRMSGLRSSGHALSAMTLPIRVVGAIEDERKAGLQHDSQTDAPLAAAAVWIEMPQACRDALAAVVRQRQAKDKNIHFLDGPQLINDPLYLLPTDVVTRTWRASFGWPTAWLRA